MTIIDDFIYSLEQSGDYTPATIFYYRSHCEIIIRKLEKLGINSDPATISEDDVKKIVAHLRENYTSATQRDYIVPLKRLCEFSNNFVFTKMKIRFPVDIRPNVDWLEYEDCKKILSTWMSPLQEIIISLELLHGLRKCEVIRITLDDLHDNYMTVRGKGRAGGKVRSIPYHPDFKKSLKRWMEYRRSLVESAESLIDQPRNLLVYLKGGKLREYEQVKGTAINRQVEDVSTRSGVAFSSHTLRRTFGRELFRSGVSIEIIATIYGHGSTNVTMLYLGLNMDDMTDALQKMRLRF